MAKETVKSGQTSDLVLAKAGEQLAGLQSLNFCISNIKNSLDDVRHGFFDIGSELSKVKDDNLFRFVGFESIYDFAEQTFGFKSTLTKNLISVYNSFKDEDGDMIEDFDEVSSSRLIELLPLKNDKDLCKDLKDMPVSSIKNAKKILDVEDCQNSVFADVLKNIVHWLVKAFDDSGIGPYKVKSAELDSTWPSYDIPMSCDSIGEFEVRLRMRDSSIMLSLEHDYSYRWYFGFSPVVIDDSDPENTIYKPLLEGLKKGLAECKKQKEAETSYKKASEEQKEAKKIPFERPKGNDAILAYLENEDNWTYGGTLYDENLRYVYCLSHCPHVYRFDFSIPGVGEDDEDGKPIEVKKPVSLYFDYFPSSVKSGELSSVKINSLASRLDAADRWN